MGVSGTWRLVKDEIGITTVFQAPDDYKWLTLLRMLRFMSYGFVGMITVRYLKLIGFTEDKIGGFITAAMLGDLVVSFLLSLVADKFGRKRILLISSVIFIVTSFTFYLTENHTLLVILATLGFFSPSGNEIGPFRSVEQSIIAQLVPLEQRSDCYLAYTFLGTICKAIGAMVSGWTIQILQSSYHFSEKDSDKVAFLLMGVLNSALLWIYLLLSPNIELEQQLELEEAVELLGTDDESLDVLDSREYSTDHQTTLQKTVSFVKSVVPSISKESRSIVFKLCLLFIIDITAKSLVNQSWLSYYMKQKFNMQPSLLGTMFFVHDVMVSILTLLGSSISKRKGIIFTMLSTHLPSIVFNSLIPVPNHEWLAIFFILGRGLFQAMDMASKQTFVASAVKPEERTVVIAWTNLSKTMGQVISPSITGYLTRLDMQWVTFILSGGLRLLYDLGLFASFWHMKDSL